MLQVMSDPKQYFLELKNDPALLKGEDGKSPRESAAYIDKKLGLNPFKVESGLKGFSPQGEKRKMSQSRSWVGESSHVFQTPYSELYEMVKVLQNYKTDSFVDLGAGYGRMAIALEVLCPKSSFVGFEFIQERVEEGNRVLKNLGVKNKQLVTQDILQDDFIIPMSDVYFIYDFSDPEYLKIILNKLSNKLASDKFFIIAKGRAIRSLIHNKYREFFALYGAYHEENWSLYSSYQLLS